MIEGHYRRGTYTHETSTAAAVVIRAKAVLALGGIVVMLFMLGSAASVVGFTVLAVLGLIILALATIVGLVIVRAVQTGVRNNGAVGPGRRPRELGATARRRGLYSADHAEDSDLQWTTGYLKVERHR